MQTNKTFWRLFLAGFLLIGFTAAGPVPPARAAACAQRSVDLVLVLDDSGSMGAASDERNDPDNLRITAAHLMVDLLDPDDRVGLVLFSDKLRETAPLGSSRSDLHDRINRFRSEGGTRLDLAVQAGLDQLGAQGDRPRALLLLTDGRPDVDPAGQAARLAGLAAQAGKSGVAFYVIGLGPNYDRNLLEQLTSVSKSEQLWHVTEAGHLSDAFLEILRNLKGLNIESSTGGTVPVLGLSPEVRFAALRRQDAPVTAIDWSGGTATAQAGAPSLPAAVTYTYDLLAYKPKTAGPGTVATRAPVLWKLERPPVEARFLEPAARQEVDSGEPLPVRISLTACDGAALPQGAKGVVTVLDANRKPLPNQAELKLENGFLTGELPMPAEAGPYVLNARILTAEGRQITVAEQTVSAAPHDRWVLEAPPTLTTGADGTVTLRHRFGGKPAAATPDPLTATLPDGTRQTLQVQPAGDPGVLTAQVTAPPDKTGTITYVLGDGKAKASTVVEPIRLRLQDLPTPIWKFKESALKLTLLGRPTGPVAGPAVLPPYRATGGAEVSSQPWSQAGGIYVAEAEFRLQDKPGWWSLRDLFVGRRVDLRLTPVSGPYLVADSADLTGWVEPLLPWYWVLAGFLVTLLLGWSLNYRLHGGPQLPVAVAAGGGAPVYLMARRPGALTRLLNTRTQRELTVGGTASKAVVQLAELPADAIVKITARGIPGRERFRVENLNKQYALVLRDVFQRSRISLKGKGPAPLVSLGGVPLRLDLHPKKKRGI